MGYGLETARFELADVAGITHLLVEPGPTLARSFLERGLTDRVWVFRSPDAMNDSPPPPPGASLTPPSPNAGRGDTLAEYLNLASPVYFAPEPSADWVLAAAALAAPAPTGDENATVQ